MKRPLRSPQFLARDNYRLRRLMDGARLLPVFGFLLLLLPLMRPTADSDRPQVAAELVYLFSVWLGLIVLAILIAARLRHVLKTPSDGLDAPHMANNDQGPSGPALRMDAQARASVPDSEGQATAPVSPPTGTG